MGKQIYLIRGIVTEESDGGYERFSDRVQKIAQSILDQHELERLSYTITEERPPSVSVVPFGKSKIASISLWHSDDSFFSDLTKAEGFAGAFKVREDLPVKYDLNWQDSKTPGICLLTLFRKKKGIKYDDFIDRWHNGHTPLSLKLHPLWHYSRNVVNSSAETSLDHYDGIVEEHTRTERELLNPFKFFGNPLMIIPNMLRVYIDVRGFLDYGSIEPYLTREYILKP